MGKPNPASPVKPVCGLLAADEELLGKGREALGKLLGPVDLQSRVFPFDLTAYYEPEMGPDLRRQFLSFERLIPPEDLAGLKLETNKLEENFASGSGRKLNLDPGYVDLSRLVLATTKDASWRVYLGRGIWAESTLRYQKGGFVAWEWTYPDYRLEATREFFAQVRRIYREAMKKEG